MAKSGNPSAKPSNARSFRIGMLVVMKESIATDLWRIVDLEGPIAQLRPISLGATQRQGPITDLRRYRIKTTDQVFWNEELVHVTRVNNPRSEELYEYEITKENRKINVREHELSVHVGSEAPDAVAQLMNLDASPGAIASARSELLHAYFEATARSVGIVGYNGARMLPIPHQINAARHVLLFGRPRFLLADEVGLGKTIEAGLIVSTLRKYFPQWRAAFFVPESLTVQWAFEMYSKFGKSIYRLSEDDEPEEGDDDPGFVMPHGKALRSFKKNAAEILVIDEAHQVLRDPDMYSAFVKLSQRAHAVLLLTATPTSDDGANLLKLLRLADPDSFKHVEREEQLATMMEKQPAVEAILRQLRDPKIPGAAILDAWKKLGIEDEVLEARLMALRFDAGEMSPRHKLAALLTDRHCPGARILRYQRKFLASDNEMPERIEEPIEYRPTKEEQAVHATMVEWLKCVKSHGKSHDPSWQQASAILVQAVHSSPLALENWLLARSGEFVSSEGVTADPVRRHHELLDSLESLSGEDKCLEAMEEAMERWKRMTKSTDMKGRALARLSRYEAFLKALQQLLDDDEPRRVLVFTSFESNVKQILLLLKKALTGETEVFPLSAEMEWREREKNAFAFQECRTACVLVSDDLGGEGRNFQFADAIVHFDLPVAPWVLEQRIGRLDRVGRSHELDVDSQILVCPGQYDNAIYDFHRDAIGVFNESIAPVEDRMEEITSRFMAALIDGGPDATADLIDSVNEQLQERRDEEEKELMARGSTGVEEVKKLVPLLDDSKELKTLRSAVVRYSRLLGSVVDDGGQRLTMTVGSHHPLHATPGVLSEMQGHFDRRLAVREERLEFFSPGHPFVRALARDAMQENADRVAFLIRGGIPRGSLVFLNRIYLPSSFLEAVRELPEDIQPSVLCAAASSFGTRMARVAVDFDGKLFSESSETDLLFRPWNKEDISLHEGPEVYEYLPKDWAGSCERAHGVAKERAAALAKGVLESGLPSFQAILSEVLTRHFGPEFAVETQIDALLFEITPLAADIDSVVVLLPPK